MEMRRLTAILAGLAGLLLIVAMGCDKPAEEASPSPAAPGAATAGAPPAGGAATAGAPPAAPPGPPAATK